MPEEQAPLPEDKQNTENTQTTTETTQPKKWFDDLDVDLKNNPSITTINSVNDLAKSFVEARKLVGADKIKVPTEKSDPKEWDEFWAKGGRPTDKNGYEVPNIQMPEELQFRKENLEAFKEQAHKLGLNKKQFAGLYGMYNEMQLNAYNQALEGVKTDKLKAETELRNEWGASYETKVDQAQQVINKFFQGKPINKAFNILASDKGFISAMADIAQSLGEDVITGQVRSTMTPAEAKSEIASMMGDPNHPLHKDIHPEHQAAVDRLIELRQYAEAGQA